MAKKGNTRRKTRKKTLKKELLNFWNRFYKLITKKSNKNKFDIYLQTKSIDGSTLSYVLILSSLIVFTFYLVVNINLNKYNEVKSKQVVTPVVVNKLSDDLLNLDNIQELKSKYNNDEINSIVYIPNTNIKEPVAQAINNTFYLNHDLYKKYYVKGSTFMDYRVDLDNELKVLVYSHNSNYYKDMPFTELEGYYNKEYYNEHRYIYLKAENYISKYEVFSIYIETADWNYTKLKFKNLDAWLLHLNYLKNKSWYDTNVSLNKNDKVLILQTCSNHKEYQKYKNKYLIVAAKRIEKTQIN